MKDFELPSNVKQIGTIGDGAKIYIEDYAYTYLNQYAKAGADSEKIAFLIGKHIVIDSQDYIFISGALQSADSEFIDGIETFTKKSFYNAGQQITKYFSGYEIMGWMQSQPGYGTYLNPFYAEYHMNTFAKRYDVMLVIDPLEKSSVFYYWNDGQTELIECPGYFVYYDKNESMNSYIQDFSVAPPLNEERSDLYGNKSEKRPVTDVQTIKLGDYERGKRPREFKRNNKYIESGLSAARRTYEDKSQNSAKGGARDQKPINMLISFSCILFVICFITGVGLIQSQDRIGRLEDNISVMSTAYNYLSNQMNQISTQAVFAPADKSDAIKQSGLADGDIATESPDLTTAPPAETGPLEAPTQKNTNQPAVSAAPPSTPSQTPVPAIQEPTAAPSVPAKQTPTAVSQAELGTGNARTDEIPETYEVQQGDNLIFISKKFYGTSDMVQAIMDYNDLTDPDMIYFGKVLKLPPK